MKLVDVIDLFLRHKSAEGLSPQTIEWYRANLLAFVRFLERAGVNGSNWLHTGTIEAFLVAERERVSASTVAARFRRCVHFCVARREPRFCDPSPMRRMKPPKIPRATSSG